MSNPVTTVQAGSEAIKEVAGLLRGLTDLLREWIAGADIRKMKAAIQAGESYIREASPILDEALKDDPKKLKELKNLEERFFKYN